ncbi:transcription factor IIA subunit alpha [Apophysomyces ossiformis]|uniref:Transcription initiation factor IIA large subunit n=1 Tax=Apophysomyces ossiformis TaxID=679940 RepID=A0A8H7ESH4_9FUNG|nr:transcription factor IIA subunit alpha [Apophysomyces ossiformis]
MSNSVVSTVYRFVIDDVINQVRGEFEDMGIDESVLLELQRSWETKVARSRVANFGFAESGYYEEGEEDNAHNHGHINLGSGADRMGGMQYPGVGLAESYSQSAASLAPLASTGSGVRPPPKQENNGAQMRISQPQGYAIPQRSMADSSTLMQPVNHGSFHSLQPAVTSQSPSNGSTIHELPLPDVLGHSRNDNHLPQNDGAYDDMTTEQIDAHIADVVARHQTNDEDDGSPQFIFSATSGSGEPLALDTLPESVKQLMREAKEKAIKVGAISSKSRIAQLDGEDDDDNDINSDLDDSDDADDDAEGAEEVENIILCLYDKVTRTKNKWKCVLKDGITLVNGRDYLFNRANGDFEW